MSACVDVGDVICVRTTGLVAKAIDAGAVIRGLPSLYNHIAVASHVDKAGTWQGIEGRPGGVGWVDLSRYINSPYFLSNAAQPRTREQRQQIAEAMRALLGTPYDWAGGIGRDVLEAVDPLYKCKAQWGPGVPGHVVCSSAADWAHEHVGLASPQPDETCTPADWQQFIAEKRWERAA